MHLHDTAHAKINLFLHVTGKREDGYHLLDSLAIFAGASDQLLLRPSLKTEPSLQISGSFSHNLSNHQDNLILKAVNLLTNIVTTQKIKTKNALTGFEIELIKELPIASGIGGGSADAACALRLLCKYWGIAVSTLEEIALQLGADVPVCLHQKTTRMQGIGEILLKTPPLPHFGILLVNPGVAVSTPSIFKKLSLSQDYQQASQFSFPKNGWNNLNDFINFLHTTRNDLEKPAISVEPLIQEVLTTLDTLPGTILSRMSGSGATCFTIFKNEDAAKYAQKELSRLPHAKTWWQWAGAPLY